MKPSTRKAKRERLIPQFTAAIKQARPTLNLVPLAPPRKARLSSERTFYPLGCLPRPEQSAKRGEVDESLGINVESEITCIICARVADDHAVNIQLVECISSAKASNYLDSGKTARQVQAERAWPHLSYACKRATANACVLLGHA